MNETICRGMKDFVYVSLGKTAYRNNPEYLELKKNFSSPGEVIERMEQYGYSSREDYISAMEVVLWMEEAFSAEQIEMLFEGTQLEDFVKKVKEKAGEEVSVKVEIPPVITKEKQERPGTESKQEQQLKRKVAQYYGLEEACIEIWWEDDQGEMAVSASVRSDPDDPVYAISGKQQ